VGGTDELLRVVHVEVGGGDVEVAGHHHLLVGRAERGDVRAQLGHPAQLVLVVLVVERATVGHVHAADAHAVADRGDDASVGVGRPPSAKLATTSVRPTFDRMATPFHCPWPWWALS
jgi:hypothetical protein